MKTPHSFHGSVAPSAVKQSISKTKKTSRSLHCSHDVPLNRYCGVHSEVSLRLRGEDKGCPNCAIQHMKFAAKTLERRAAELELKREEMEVEEKAKRKRRKDRKAVSSSLTKPKTNKQKSKKSPDEEGEDRDQDMKALLSWSTAFEYGSSQRSSEINSSLPEPSSERQTKSKSSTKVRGNSRSPPRRLFSIGQVAQPSQIDESSTRAETLIKIARLREGDGAWVKRSADVWTYATLKARENGPDACLVFTVNARGSSKNFPMNLWAKFVRIVAENHDDSDLEREEEEIDMMMSDLQLRDSSPTEKWTKSKGREDERALAKRLNIFTAGRKDERGLTKSLNKSSSGREDERAPAKSLNTLASGREDARGLATTSLNTFESEPTTGSSDSVPSKDSFSKASNKDLTTGSTDSVPSKDSSSRGSPKEKEEAAFFHDHDVSMYTLALQDPTTGSTDTMPNKDSSSRGSNKGKGETVVLHDHDVSMYTLALQDNSCPPILEYGSASEDDKQKRHVSFRIPEDEGQASVKSSMTSMSESSFCEDYDADAEEPSTRNAPTDAGKVKKILQRSRTFPLPHPIREHHREQNKSSKRRPIRRVSCEMVPFKEEMKVDMKKRNSKRHTVNGSNIQKKKLNELNRGETIPKHQGQDKHGSFYSALKSMHRRSSVLMPPTSRVAN